MSNDIIPASPDDSLKTWGWVSYFLHLLVAVAAVLPGAQVSIALLLVALVIDLVKRDDAAGTWQASHFSWRSCWRPAGSPGSSSRSGFSIASSRGWCG
jgi:uncharacterized membrane protein